MLLSYIYSEICRIIDIQDGHFKIQDGGQVLYQYQFHTNPYIMKCMCANFGSPVVNIFWHMPDYILTATILKLNMAAGYHVDSDGYPASYEFIYIKLQVCQCWCFYHKMHNPTKKWSLAAVLYCCSLSSHHPHICTSIFSPYILLGRRARMFFSFGITSVMGITLQWITGPAIHSRTFIGILVLATWLCHAQSYYTILSCNRTVHDTVTSGVSRVGLKGGFQKSQI